MNASKLVMIVILISLAGCDSDTASSVSTGDDSDAGGMGPALVLDNDDVPQARPTMGGQPVFPPAAGSSSSDGVVPDQLGPKYVETTLAPRQPLYTLGDAPQVRYVVQDKYARILDDYPVTLRVFPDGIGQIDDEGRLSFNEEGAGFVRVCAAVELCGRVNFFVDDGPPKLEVTSPVRAEQLSGEPVIEVEGMTDANSTTRVFVNDEEIPVDENGRFSSTIQATFGLNRVDIVADDGVRRPSVRWVSEVMWAPRYIAPDPQETRLGSILTLRIDNELFDGGPEPAPAADDGVLIVHDLASAIETLLERADLSQLISDPQLAADDDLQFRVLTLWPGRPDVGVLMTDNGFELFFRLEAMGGRFSGQTAFAGERVALDGEIDLSIAAFARIDSALDDEAVLRLSVGEIGVAVEALAARMEDELAQAAVETAASLVRVVLNSFGAELFQSLIADRLTDVVEVGLREVLAPLTSVSLSMGARAPLPAFDLTLKNTPTPPVWTSRGHVDLTLDGAVRSEAPFEAPYPSPGIPDLEADLEPLWPARMPIVLGVRLLALNGLLEALWRQRLLQLDLTSAVPPGFLGIDEVRIDGRLPPVVVPAPSGGPHLLELQIGALDLIVGTDSLERPARYVVSLRVGLGVSVEGGLVRSVADERVDVRIQYIPTDDEAPPIPIELILPLVEGELGRQLVDSVSTAITVNLPAVSVGEDVLGPWVPTVAKVEINPSWPQGIQVRRGWLMLPADAEFKIVPVPEMP
ncbi:MAG: hypothetical protein VX589_10580 [Myxococcota bacterium]|nr:hypothetical protein [Myxococcota bacterium]